GGQAAADDPPATNGGGDLRSCRLDRAGGARLERGAEGQDHDAADQQRGRAEHQDPTRACAYGGVQTTAPSAPPTALAVSLSRLEAAGFTPISRDGTATR